MGKNKNKVKAEDLKETQDVEVVETVDDEPNEEEVKPKMTLKRKLAIAGGIALGALTAIGAGVIFKQKKDIEDLEDYIADMDDDEDTEDKSEDSSDDDLVPDVDPGI